MIQRKWWPLERNYGNEPTTTTYHVLAVEPWRLDGSDKKLGTVGVGTSVGHRENTWTGVLQRKVFILKLVSVDGFATSAVVVGEVAALTHKVGDHTVEDATLVTEALLAGAEGSKVFGGLGDDIGAKLKIKKIISLTVE